MAKKSNFFCVATEGAATDGRTITREWIQQMADTFNRQTYGARVWLEHVRGLLPDSPFKAYGDVLALEAREKESGKLGLFAQIEPTDDLVKMNKARQKLYTSIEIQPDFAGTGKAYLVGLAVTDSPASLGTDMLAFTQKNPSGSVLTERKQDKDNLFSEGVEVELEFVVTDNKPSLTERLDKFRKKFTKQIEKSDGQTEQLLQAVEELAEFSYQSMQEHEAQHQDAQEAVADLVDRIEELNREFTEFKQNIEQSDASRSHRPAATGGNGSVLTDC